MKNLIIAVAVLVSTSAFAANTKKCIQRIEDACNLSLLSSVGLEANVKECKQVAKGLESVLLVNGKVSVIDTNGRYCTGSQYKVDGSGIKETKSIDQRLFMLSYDGQVYFMDDDQDFYEILNSRRQSYSSVVNIRGTRGGQEIVLDFANGQSSDSMSYSDLVDKARKGQLRKIYRYNSSSILGLFW